MRSAHVYKNSILAGVLTEEPDKTFKFEYDSEYWNNDDNRAISLTLPKTLNVHVLDHLFPFFFNMLAEGVNRNIQLRHLQISEEDHFGLLLATSSIDSIGAVTVKEIVG